MTIPIAVVERRAGIVQVGLTGREIGELPQFEPIGEGTNAGDGGGG